MKKDTITPMSITLPKIRSTWIKNLSFKHEIRKQLEDDIDSTLQDPVVGKDFLKKTPLVEKSKSAIEIWTLIKWKSLCTARETITQMKAKPREQERIYASYTSNNAEYTQKKISENRVKILAN